MPTKRKLPQSQLVAGAYVHCFELREGGVSVLVALHAQVRKYEQLLGTTKWHMTSFPSTKTGPINFALTPVSRTTRVDILAMDLVVEPDSPKQALIVFKTAAEIQAQGKQRKRSAALVTRRQHHVLKEAEHVFA